MNFNATSGCATASVRHDGRWARSDREQKCRTRPSSLTKRRKSREQSMPIFGDGSPGWIRTSDHPINRNRNGPEVADDSPARYQRNRLIGNEYLLMRRQWETTVDKGQTIPY